MVRGNPFGPGSIDELLKHEVYPALFNRLNTAFPEFGWRRTGNSWTATVWPQEFPHRMGHENPTRPVVYQDRPWRISIQGHFGVRFLAYVNGGQIPSPTEYIPAARTIFEKAGVPFPEREYLPKDAEREARMERRRNALDAVIAHCQENLWSERGRATRDYLVKESGLTEEAIKDLELGLYPSATTAFSYLEGEGVDKQAAAEVVWTRMEGYVIFPWADAIGEPLTLYGCWPGHPPRDLPKFLTLPGEGTKTTLLYFDKVRQARHKDVILVEGVFDAAICQEKGDSRVVACAAAELSGSQVETLARHRPTSVTICLDPDGGGERGTLSCITSLREAGIKTYVPPPLPDRMNPHEFVIKNGIDAWKEHIDRKVHSLRYQAEILIRRRKTKAEWTDVQKVAVLDEAIALDAATTAPSDITDLDLFFWPVIRQAIGSSEEAIEVRRVEAREKQARERIRSEHESLLLESQNLMREGNVEEAKEFLRAGIDRLRAEERTLKADPILCVRDEMEDHARKLERWAGKEYIGLIQKTLPTLDDATLGFRGLMLLAAGPNVGKTSLGVQFGLDVVKHNEGACFLFLSLEMSRWEMISRMKCRLAESDWPALVFGKGSPEKVAQVHYGTLRLAELGERVRILDERNFPMPTLEKVIHQVRDLKARTGSSRAFVLMDYLQVWPLPPSEAQYFTTESDADKWRVGAMKTLRDALEGDAVMVISEARRPGEGTADEWGGGLADVMATARGAYTPDMVFLLNPLSDEALLKVKGGNVPSNKDQKKLEAERVRGVLQRNGVSWNTFAIAKGRDGVHRTCLDLSFWLRESRFEEGFQRTPELLSELTS